jgi:hypothetical protein
MTGNDFALMMALIGGSVLIATFFAWRGGEAKRDLALLGGSGLTLGGISALMFAF